jgi:hypothetical protein
LWVCRVEAYYTISIDCTISTGTLPAPIQLPEKSLIPPNHLHSTSETSQMETFSEFQGTNNDNSIEESALYLLPISPCKIIIPFHIKYSIWMRDKINENKYQYLHVVTLGPIEPYPVDVTQNPPAFFWTSAILMVVPSCSICFFNFLKTVN